MMKINPTFILLIFSAFLCGCDYSEAVYLENATIGKFTDKTEFPFLKDRNKSAILLLEGHYVSHVNHMVLMLRNFDSGNWLTTDDEEFEKLSISLTNPPFDKQINIDSSNVKLFYSTGSSAWVRRGNGQYSNAGEGTLLIKKGYDQLEADFDLKIFLKSARNGGGEIKTVKIQGHYYFQKMNLENLTPWQGKPDSKIGSEVYPP